MRSCSLKDSERRKLKKRGFFPKYCIKLGMFNLLPLTFVFSLLLWASVLYIFVGCAQLLIFERIAKRENPNVRNYSTMSDDQKKNVRKIGWKIARGLVTLIALALLDHYLTTGK